RGWLQRFPGDTITNIDCLTYAGSVDNLEEAERNPGHRHVTVDLADAEDLRDAWPKDCNLIVHFAAETHVDRSLEDAGRFVRTNVLGTQALLAMAAASGAPPVVIISSDEVYGPTPKGQVFGTGEPLRPTSPYAASKAAADWLGLAYAHSYGMDVTIIRSVNVFGPRQYPEKLIPLFTARALAKESLPLYGHGRQRRSWLYVDDFVSGLVAILSGPGRRRERPVWHLGSPDELENRAIAGRICELCGADPGLIVSVADRPGHDRRYALDWSQTKRVFGWQPQTTFADGLGQTVEWIKSNLDWCRQRIGWTPTFLRE
ncbi:MAG: GDP-mannose 4,6-dehydratase, partial [candidate division Zixibacteria bacterium]|nr:GDP-mannose 4,6-dehydratase [candidate division Zixibacteria bacterium]